MDPITAAGNLRTLGKRGDYMMSSLGIGWLSELEKDNSQGRLWTHGKKNISQGLFLQKKLKQLDTWRFVIQHIYIYIYISQYAIRYTDMIGYALDTLKTLTIQSSETGIIDGSGETSSSTLRCKDSNFWRNS